MKRVVDRKRLNNIRPNGETIRRYLEDYKRVHPMMYYILFDIIALSIIALVLIFAWFGFCQFIVHLRS